MYQYFCNKYDGVFHRVEERQDGTLWIVFEEEEQQQVNYCPMTGYAAKVQVGDPHFKPFPDGEILNVKVVEVVDQAAGLPANTPARLVQCVTEAKRLAAEEGRAYEVRVRGGSVHAPDAMFTVAVFGFCPVPAGESIVYVAGSDGTVNDFGGADAD